MAPRATLDAEDEAAAEAPTRALLATPALAPRTSSAAAPPDVLVVGIGGAAAHLVFGARAAGEVAGSVVLPEVSARGNAAEPCAQDAACWVREAPAAGAALAACAYAVPLERARAWADALLRAVGGSPGRVVAAAALEAGALRGAALEAAVFAVDTDAERARRAGGAPGGPLPLPPGTVVTGAGAALLELCQMRGVPARLLVCVQHAPVPDALWARALADAIEAEHPVGAHASLCATAGSLNASATNSGAASLFV